MKGLWLVTLSLALAACSSAPEKPKPTSLTKLATPLEMRVVERVRLGGDPDLNGLAPAVDQAVIAAAGSDGRVMLAASGLTTSWDVNLKTDVIGGDRIAENVLDEVGPLIGRPRSGSPAGTHPFAHGSPSSLPAALGRRTYPGRQAVG